MSRCLLLIPLIWNGAISPDHNCHMLSLSGGRPLSTVTGGLSGVTAIMRNGTSLPRWRTRCSKWKLKSEEWKEVKGAGRSWAGSSVAWRSGTRVGWGKELNGSPTIPFIMWINAKPALAGGGSSSRYWRMKRALLAERHKSSREAENTLRAVLRWPQKATPIFGNDSRNKTFWHLFFFQEGFHTSKDDCCSRDGTEKPTVWAGNTMDVWKERAAGSGSADSWQRHVHFFIGEVSTQEKRNYCRIAFNDQGEQSGDQACDSRAS